ncbi:Ser-Thr-rich glycosyl-phosphatidyl-inositol-anchored membrane family domain containing protein [Elaphomyces granulatus]
MRFFCLVLGLFAALVAAGPNPISWNSNTFTAGQSSTITWQPTTGGTVTLRLQWGSNPTPGSGITIASTIQNSGSVTWTPPSNLASQPDFTIVIVDDQDTSQTNYSPHFTISGLSGSATSSNVASSTLVSSVSSSAASSSAATSSSSSNSSTSSGSSSTPSSTVSSASSASSPSSTPSSTSSTSGSSSTPASSSGPTSTNVPNTKNAGMRLTVSGGMLAVVMGVMAVM